MPIDNSLPDKKFPMKWYKNAGPSTQFLDHLNSIKVDLLDAPGYHDLLEYAPRWGLATWEDRPRTDYSMEEKMDFLHEMFSMRTLPSVLETIGLTFLISNIDLVDVTHLLRHRTFSFSAHCTGDRDQRLDSALVKPSIKRSLYYEDYKNAVKKCKDVYASMLDSGDISVLDARTILPRCMENHYYARCNLKDALHFIKQRLDRQIQPESDNIVAMQMLLRIATVYPAIKNTINLDAPDEFYVRSAQTDHSSNLYMPEQPRNDVFPHKPQWFVYQKQRHEMLGGDVFVNLWKRLVREYNSL